MIGTSILAVLAASSGSEITPLKEQNEINVFHRCVMQSAKVLESAGETAEETAQAAVRECGSKRLLAYASIRRGITAQKGSADYDRQLYEAEMMEAVMDTMTLADAKKRIMQIRIRTKAK